MIAALKELIAALREELQHYGEMLARLDEQQDLVMRREADPLLQCVAAIQQQGVAIQTARATREERQMAVARELGLKETEFAQMIPRLPEEYRPLLEALVQENNELLLRIQRRARQNHLLLTQSVELMHRFITSLFPTVETKVYNPGGQVFQRTTPSISLYEAVG
ncbi:MAG: flagellar protein FlgN [Verrucomicrobiota bacterium]|nr:flagellar protein FlgN [Verrucomicrobiota bacterium]